MPCPGAELVKKYMGSVVPYSDNFYATLNTAVFITDLGVVIVDTKLAGWGQPLLDKIKTITSRPIATIINTHAHGDHTGSNEFFGTAVEIIAPDLETTPHMRIVKVYAADLMFHAIAGTWTFRAHGHHRYTITAGTGDQPLWTLATHTGITTASNNIAELVDHILTAEAA